MNGIFFHQARGSSQLNENVMRATMSMCNLFAVLDFRDEVESIRSDFLQTETSPVVVHCRSGVGRTGVFILADLMIAHLQNQTRQVGHYLFQGWTYSRKTLIFFLRS